MVNLELYRIFYIVATVGNITKASEELNISQPAVTKHIRNLEEQIGQPLFIRTKRGVVLNEYGEKVFLAVKKALNILNEVEQEINESKSQNIGHIKIDISSTLARKFLLKYMKEFEEIYPNITIDITTEPTLDSIKELKKGRVDFIIGKFPHQKDLDLEYIKLGESKYIFVGNEKYKELSERDVSLEELSKLPIMVQDTSTNSGNSISKYCKENNIEINPKMTIASSILLVEFAIMGYGLSYVTKLYVEDELKEKKLYEIKVKPEAESIDYGIILLKNNVITSPCKKFIDFLKNN